MKIRIIEAEKWNWYKDKIGCVYQVKDDETYQPLGVQVYKEDNGKSPDIVQNKHFVIID